MVDVDFLALCIRVREDSEIKFRNEYISQNGFINFYNGNCVYAVIDCPATRKYLESKRYSYNPDSNIPCKWYNEDSLYYYLKNEGPTSHKYRKLLSYISGPVKRGIWGVLSKKQSAYDIFKSMEWLSVNNLFLGVHTGKEFLTTPWGKYSILQYAQVNGLNFYDKINDMLREKGYFPGDSFDRYLECLGALPTYEFIEILNLVEQQKKENDNHHSRR